MERAERRRGRSGLGALILATILIVAGLGILFPNLPWEIFWAGLLILLGVWIAFGWTMRGRSKTQMSSQQ
jgi:membrane protein implicated in regulation of membrane protease activity